jgi:hypothetical protein
MAELLKAQRLELLASWTVTVFAFLYSVYVTQSRKICGKGQKKLLVGNSRETYHFQTRFQCRSDLVINAG